MKSTDHHLIRRIRQGDAAAFEEVFRQWYPMLVGYARKLLGGVEDAEEVVQDFFCHWWDRRTELQPGTSLQSYLFTSVRNRCLNRLDHLKVRQKTEEGIREALAGWGSKSDPVQQTEALELEERIARAVEELPDRCREVFLKSRYEGKRYEQIAEEMQISPRTVETQIGKALRHLRGALRDLFPAILVVLGLSFFGKAHFPDSTAERKSRYEAEKKIEKKRTAGYGFGGAELSQPWKRWKT